MKRWIGVILLCILGIFLICDNSAYMGDYLHTVRMLVWTEHQERIAPEMPVENYYYYEQLTHEQKVLYNEIYAALKTMSPELAVTGNPEDIPFAMEAVCHDHPELFWFGGSYGWTEYDHYGMFCIIRMRFEYTDDKETVMKKQEKVEQEAKKLLAKVDLQAEQEEIIHQIYELVIEDVTYDLNAPENQTLYSSLVNKRTVCAGWSKEFQYLLQQVGVEALYVTGEIGETRDGHAWNMAKYAGDYYHFDVTFGSTDETGLYFATRDKLMYKQRYPTQKLEIPGSGKEEFY